MSSWKRTSRIPWTLSGVGVYVWLIVMLEIAFWMIFGHKEGKWFYPDDQVGYFSLLILVTPVALPVFCLATVYHGYRLRGWRRGLVMGLAIVALPVVGIKDYVPILISVMWGGGVGQAVAEVNEGNSWYRARSIAAGDPTVSVLTVYRCNPVRWWCEAVGALEKPMDRLLGPRDRVELAVKGPDVIEMTIEGVLVLKIEKEQVECWPPEGVECR